MAESALPPMAPGGQWLRSSADQEPQYVVHEAHIKRLLMDGWQPTGDPRKPVEQVAVTPDVDPEKEEMKQQIAQLQAMLQQVLDAKGEPPNGSQTDNDPTHQQSAANDSRSKRSK